MFVIQFTIIYLKAILYLIDLVDINIYIHLSPKLKPEQIKSGRNVKDKVHIIKENESVFFVL